MEYTLSKCLNPDVLCSPNTGIKITIIVNHVNMHKMLLGIYIFIKYLLSFRVLKIPIVVLCITFIITLTSSFPLLRDIQLPLSVDLIILAPKCFFS